MTTRFLIPRPDREPAKAFPFGRLLLSGLLVALPAFAATAASASAGDKDRPRQVQQRQSSRAAKVQANKPSPPPSSPPPTVTAKPRPSSPPPSTATAKPRPSSPPARTVTAKPRTSSPPSVTSSGRGYDRETPARVDRQDDDRRRTWTYDGDKDYRGESSRTYDHDRNRDWHRDRDHRSYRGHRHHRYCGHWGYYDHWRYNRYPWLWPWWPTIYVESDHRSANDGWGALDLDVSPERAEIYLDGQYVGIADEYDGFPSYLWLQEGTYDLAVYLEGYETIFRQVSIYPGIVIDVENSMRRGESIHPDDYGPTSTARRDARIERNREKEAYAREMEEREAARETWSGDDPISGAGASVGRLFVSVLPPDAAVYLDGHFLGTAGEIGQLSAGLVVEPGDHVLELVRPGYDTHREEIVVPPGERVSLELELERD